MTSKDSIVGDDGSWCLLSLAACRVSIAAACAEEGCNGTTL